MSPALLDFGDSSLFLGPSSLHYLLLPGLQVSLWEPWTWCWIPVLVWRHTVFCTKPKTRRFTGQWHAVGGLSLGGLGEDLRREETGWGVN